MLFHYGGWKGGTEENNTLEVRRVFGSAFQGRGAAGKICQKREETMGQPFIEGKETQEEGRQGLKEGTASGNFIRQKNRDEHRMIVTALERPKGRIGAKGGMQGGECAGALAITRGERNSLRGRVKVGKESHS